MADPHSEAPSRSHRPLPSVDIPLLPEERRANRLKRLVVSAVLGVGLAATIAAVVVARLQKRAPEEEDFPPPVATQPQAPLMPAAPVELGAAEQSGEGETPWEVPMTSAEGEGRTVTRPFGKALAFRQALKKAGVSEEDCSELEQALTGVMDFRRCRPTDELVLHWDTEGHLDRFEYHPNSVEYYEARRDDEGELHAEKVKVPIDVARLKRAGTVHTSLGDALERVGLGRSLVGAFVQMFEGRVNFSTDARTGDTFRIIVDKESVHGEPLGYGRVHAVEYVGERTGTLHAFWFKPSSGQGDYFDESGRALQGGWLRTPLRYDHISSRFDMRRRHPILKRIVPHTGVDYAAGAGTPVRAAAAGTVKFAGRKGANGNLVAIRHANGYETAYAHLLRIEKGIERSTRVKQRQVIGYVGSTGRSTGPHLHFALKKHGRYINPVPELNGPGKLLPPSQRRRFQRHAAQLKQELRNTPLHRAVVAVAPTGTEARKSSQGSSVD